MNYIFMAEGFEEIEAITVIDILRRADIVLKTVSINESKKVTGDHGLTIETDLTMDEVSNEEVSTIILPGGGGTQNLEKSESLTALLEDAFKNNKNLFAICAAPSIFGKLGFLVDKKATCYPGFEQYLEGYKKCDQDVCIDGNIVTSRGPGTAHKFAYAIVEYLKSKAVSEELQEGMLFK
jgi:4-methyl-5(b-hydroxyethyl)-thiazole monophosphate biosynthesis